MERGGQPLQRLLRRSLKSPILADAPSLTGKGSKAQQPVGSGAVFPFIAALPSGLKLEKAHPVPLCLTAVQLVEKYHRCGFSKVWFASAFKGATGVNQSLTLTGHHLRNQLEWLQVASRSPAGVLEGIALTGWQR